MRVRFAAAAICVVVLQSAGVAAAAPGDLDPSFSGDGKATYNAGTSTVSYSEQPSDSVVQPDGKVLLSMIQIENGGGGPVVARLTASGALDTTFSGDGIASLVNQGQISSIELQADGKIVVGGYLAVGGFDSIGVVVRLNSDGTLDTSYSGDGRAEIDLGGGLDQILDLAIAGDGDVVASGQSAPPASASSPIVVRLQGARRRSGHRFRGR